MEMDLRAVPDSHKIVGTATPHHGQAYGSIILYDPRIPDDDAMARATKVVREVRDSPAESRLDPGIRARVLEEFPEIVAS